MKIIVENKPYRQYGDDEYSIGKLIVGPYNIEAVPVNPQYTIKITYKGKTIGNLDTHLDSVAVSRLFNALENENIDTALQLADRIEYHTGENVSSALKYKQEALKESINSTFKKVVDEFMPSYGEGDNKLTQFLVAANKLIHKWYNDGDVFDSCNGLGWANDISGSANWLYKYSNDNKIKALLDKIYNIYSEEEYERNIIKPLEAYLDRLASTDYFKELAAQPKVGNAYNEQGNFSWVDPYDDEDENEDW